MREGIGFLVLRKAAFGVAPCSSAGAHPDGERQALLDALGAALLLLRASDDAGASVVFARGMLDRIHHEMESRWRVATPPTRKR
ncbi:MAG TPA: hypothetical protein ENK43_04500 [Planctomycetes bacterium]|nr:hypothetical protein [Planctomycetota bacterium]